MEANDYVIQYPLDAVHPDKFAELLGKPRTAVVAMIEKTNCRSLSFATRQNRKRVPVTSLFSFQSSIAVFVRRFITARLNNVMHGCCGWGYDYE